MTPEHPSPDFELMPDVVCGHSYRNPDSEARAVAMREGEQTPFSGCGKPLRWLYAYRCRQCGRWLHGPCMDRHFGEDAALSALQQRVERLTGALRKAEWGAMGTHYGEFIPECPVCLNNPVQRHADDCELSAALADAGPGGAGEGEW